MSFVKKVVNGVWRVASLVWIAIVVGGIMSISNQRYSSPMAYAIMYAMIGLIGVLYVAAETFVFGMKRRCSCCRKMFAMKRTGREYVGSDNISILTEVKRYNNNHDKIGTREEYIPGTRKWYRKVYTCKCCGHQRYISYCKDYKNI